MIYLASDHGGFNYKEKLKKIFDEKKIKYIDMGTNSNERCDAIDFASNACRQIQKSPINRGIFICRSGQMMAIVANKFSSVRAGCCFDEKSVISSRQHNNINVLATGADVVSFNKLVKMVDLFLETKFIGGVYKKRLDKLANLEKELNEKNK